MAAGLPVAALDVGDIRAMLAPENASKVVVREDEAGFTALLQDLAEDADRRRSLGAANQEQAFAKYDQAQMFAAYESLFAL